MPPEGMTNVALRQDSTTQDQDIDGQVRNLPKCFKDGESVRDEASMHALSDG
jgi:hypothetical protein